MSLNKIVLMQYKREYCRTAFYASRWEIERVSRACSLCYGNFAISSLLSPFGRAIVVNTGGKILIFFNNKRTRQLFFLLSKFSRSMPSFAVPFLIA